METLNRRKNKLLGDPRVKKKPQVSLLKAAHRDTVKSMSLSSSSSKPNGILSPDRHMRSFPDDNTPGSQRQATNANQRTTTSATQRGEHRVNLDPSLDSEDSDGNTTSEPENSDIIMEDIEDDEGEWDEESEGIDSTPYISAEDDVDDDEEAIAQVPPAIDMAAPDRSYLSWKSEHETPPPPPIGTGWLIERVQTQRGRLARHMAH
jgi:hypothetical protein